MFFFYREVWKLGRKIAGCICFTLIIGPILILAGGLVLANASKYSRSDAIDNYNGEVSAWTSNGYAAFQKYPGTVLEINSGTPFVAVTVSGARSVLPFTQRRRFLFACIHFEPVSFLLFLQPQNNPSVETGSGISTYSSTLAYSASQAAINSGTSFWPTAYTTTTSPLILGASGAQLYGGSINLFLKNVISNFCSASDSVGACTSRCSTSYTGYYDPGTRSCTTWFTLSNICFVLDPSTGKLDTSWTAGSGNSGCIPQTANGFPSSLWGAAFVNNGVGPFGYTASSSQPSQVSWGSLRVTVRSSADPWVDAVRLTSGNPGSFGLSTASKVAIGFGLIFSGLGVCGFVLLVSWCLVRSMRKREAGNAGAPAAAGYVVVPSQPVNVVVAGAPNPFGQVPAMPYPQQGGPGMMPYAPPGGMYAPPGSAPVAAQYGASPFGPSATGF